LAQDGFALFDIDRADPAGQDRTIEQPGVAALGPAKRMT
jgi:hypothetical protein